MIFYGQTEKNAVYYTCKVTSSQKTGEIPVNIRLQNKLQEELTMSVLHINNANFEAEVLGSSKPVLVDFFATWCGPCRMVAPVIDEIAEEREDIKVCKIDVDQASELAIRYGVASIPTLMVFKNGEISNKALGAMPKEDILELLD